MGFSRFTTSNGETILYKGSPNLPMLEMLADGPGDIWHSSLDFGFRDAFPDLVYQTATFFWFLNDFHGLDQSVSWRLDPDNFAVRETVWDQLGGFDLIYTNPFMQALDFAYNALRNQGAVPLYQKGLFTNAALNTHSISREDRYGFFARNFKKQHSLFMLYRKGFWNIAEWVALSKARKKYPFRPMTAFIPSRNLEPLKGKPAVSYIIPTMNRQDYTLQLLDDLQNQEYLPLEVIVVDATQPDMRDESLYDPSKYSFDLKVFWQQTKGSCRARNEAITACTGEYILFGDDDIRIPPDFVEKHLRFLQTNKVDASGGLDIRADDYRDNLSQLTSKLAGLEKREFAAGVVRIFSNSNGCVKRDKVLEVGGNDINYDGGYGEDGDFAYSLIKQGTLVLTNPYSVNLHLKPPAGGYRVWGAQARQLGKTRKIQPWELDHPVKWLRPAPSPTVMYFYYKHHGKELIKEYKHKYFFTFLFKGSLTKLPKRLFNLPYRIMQFNKSVGYAKRLVDLGKRSS
ncbi:glycosyltransferase [Flavobacterium sp. SE-s28]|uniref:Glycosyltransferase n=1 Tax=Flavobacterium silvaticum TaxID=1852020 RepID=A0A972FPI1_9FLAO|nr:glycosyltransferase [Flavobacterium silvaticum]